MVTRATVLRYNKAANIAISPSNVGQLLGLSSHLQAEAATVARLAGKYGLDLGRRS